MEPFWKKRQQQEADNQRTDASHPHKRLDAIDEAIGNLKEAAASFKDFIGNWREKLETLWNERGKTMADLTALKAAVDANTAAVAAATTAINTLVAQGVDPTVIAGFTSQLQTNNTTLQNAVAAVTPAPVAPAAPSAA
jgi:hypothetical protein